MAQDADTPVEIFATFSEFEASAIAASLNEQGIKAMVFGGNLTGLRAETVAMAQVMVRRADFERAREVIGAIRAESVDIDWDQVDVAGGPAGITTPAAALPVRGPKAPPTEPVADVEPRTIGWRRQAARSLGRGYVWAYIVWTVLVAGVAVYVALARAESRAFFIPVAICGLAMLALAYFVARRRG